MSNTNTIVIQWGAAVTGRENMGLELFLGVSQYYQGLVNDKNLGNFQTILLETGNFGDISGLMILTGTEEQIDTIAKSEKHRENVTKATHIVNNIRLASGITGDLVPTRIQELTRWRKELGL